MSDQQQQPLLTVTIDGRTVQVPKGTLLVEAARQAGIEIPIFCYHPKLDPAGVCRMCLVQVEKIPKPQTACTTPVADGMVVHTQNDLVKDLQKGVLEFLLLNHPLDCPVCDKGGECELQDHTFEHGQGMSRNHEPKIRQDKAVDLGNFIVLDNERCILCRRCTRFDDEIATEGNLIIQERGHNNVVTTLLNEGYDSYFSGNTIELCPVGALTSDIYRFKARPWDLARVGSVCSGCSVGCETVEEFRHGELLRITARDVDTVDNGWLCDRGRFNYKFVHAGDRVTQPLVKRNGEFVPVTWAEAMETIATRFKAIKAEGGAKSFGVIGGGKLTNEEAYLLQKFARVTLGTHNVDHRVSDQVVTSLGNFPGKQTDLSDAGAILVLDTDPAETAPVLDLRIRRMADRKKAKIAVVGSVMPQYRGRHARIQTKPGETAGVVAALAAAAAAGATPKSAADPVAVQKLAELLTGANKVVIVWGGNDASIGRALVELTGALKQSGRSVHVLIPGAQHNSRGAEAMGVLPGPGGLTTGEMLKAAVAGEVKALYIAGANLLSTFPDRKLAEEGVTNAFVVTTELFLNESAQLADVVLPASSLSEKTGTFTTLDGTVQAVKQAKKAAGLCQQDGDILVALAAATGAKLASSPADTAAEIAKLVGKLEVGAVLKGAPVSLLSAQSDTAAETPTPNDGALLLVPITKLYAGTSTAKFDAEFNHVQPVPTAFFNPADAARRGLKTGDPVELVASGAAIRLTAQVDRSVVPGTVQAIRSLSEAPVTLLTAGAATVPVNVAKLAVEVAD